MRIILNTHSRRLERSFNDRKPATLAEYLRAERGSAIPIELFTRDDKGWTTPGTTEYTISIGRPGQLLESGRLTLDYGGTDTAAIDLAQCNLGARIESALNAHSGVSAAGGVDVVKLAGGGGYKIEFRAVGAVSTLSPTVSGSGQPSGAYVSAVTTGSATVKAVQYLILEEAVLASVIAATDWSASSSPTLTITQTEVGTADTVEIVTLSISGDPAPESVFVLGDGTNFSTPVSVDATGSEVAAVLNVMLTDIIASVKRTEGRREWVCTYSSVGDQASWVEHASTNLVRRPAVTASLSLATSGLLALASPNPTPVRISIKKGTETVYYEDVAIVQPPADATATSTLVAVAFLPLAGGTMTGQINFSGTDHAGLKLLSLTTAERDALTPAEGMLVYNESTSRIEGYANGAWRAAASDEPNTLAEALSTIDHVWLCSETVSDSQFWDVGAATAMHLSSNGTVPGATESAAFEYGRTLVAASSQYGGGSAMPLSGGAFAMGVCCDFTIVASARPIAGISDLADNAEYIAYLYREGVNDLRFRTQRAAGGGTTNDILLTDVVYAGTDYNLISEFTGAEMLLTIDGDTTTHEAAFGMYATETNATINLGRVQISATPANNYHDGNIFAMWAHAGTLTDRQRELIGKATRSDWRDILWQRQGIIAFGDSLKANNPYPSTATALGLDFGGWPVRNEGIGSQSSSAILARLQAFSELKFRIVMLGLGNVNTSDPVQVIADIAQARIDALAKGAELVLIEGVTKRDAATSISNVNDINTASAALATANPTNTLYFDLQDFYINTYVSRTTAFGGGTTIADDDADKAANIVPRSAKDVAGDSTKTHMNATAVAESTAAMFAQISSNF